MVNNNVFIVFLILLIFGFGFVIEVSLIEVGVILVEYLCVIGVD